MRRAILIPLACYWEVEQRRRNKGSMPKWWTHQHINTQFILDTFSGLPTVLKQHIQSYYKSTLPTHKCVVCGRRCWDDCCGYAGCLAVWQYEFFLECLAYDGSVCYYFDNPNPIVYHIKRRSLLGVI